MLTRLRRSHGQKRLRKELSNRIDAESEGLDRGCAKQVIIAGFGNDNSHHTVGSIQPHQHASGVALDCLSVGKKKMMG